MNRQELIDKVRFITEDGYKELQLFGFIAGDDNAYRISISSDLETELIDVISNGVNSLLIEKEYEIVAFSTADSRKDQYYLYDLNETPERMAQMSYVLGNHNVPKFNLQEHKVNDINTLIILVSDGNGRAFSVYKALSPVEKVVKSTKQVLVKFGVGDDYLIEESCPLLRISPRFQIVYSDDMYCFLESSTLEGQFKLHQILNNEVAQKITVIEETGLLKDVNKLKQYTDKIAFSRKLVGVIRSSKVIREQVSKEKVLTFIATDDDLCNSIKITNVDGERYISITTRKSAKKFLDLLNDEFLVSELTQQKYQAVDKDER